LKIQSKSSSSWLCIIGVDDVQANSIKYNDHGMNLSAAYQGCDDKNVNILLAHQPVAAKIALKDSRFNFQLILSGHTHGGQIYSLALPIYLLNPFYRGLYQIDASHAVYVTQGTFYFGMPMRWGSRSEITDITLLSAEN